MLLATLLKPFNFRGKARLLHSLCPKYDVRKARIFGYWTHLDLQNFIERSIYLHIFEPYESALARSYLRPGMTFVDAGANIGYYTLMASSIIGDAGHVYAFEPSPYAVGKLKETVRENDIGNVTITEAALGDAKGEAAIYLSKSRANHTPTMIENDGGRPHMIRVEMLDEFLEKHSISRVDLLKIDVEGFEPNIIRGAQRALTAGKVAVILCEFNEHWLLRNHSSSVHLMELLASFGFRSVGQEFNRRDAIQNLFLIHSSHV